ncbi:MAG: type II secretion system F family protein [Oscillospiraceae bacterium]|nr:type II secretion system F family protein [Oscillospiraceae bacterium]
MPMYFAMLICAIVSTLLILVWMMLFFRFRKEYARMLDDIDKDVFILKEIYFIGLGGIEIYEQAKQEKITNNEKAIEKKKQLAEVFGRDNAELYYYILMASRISLILTIAPLGLLLICVVQSWYGLLGGIALTALFVYSVNSSINNAMEKKKESILSEFPRMVSKLTLLINAGMLVRRAWDEVAESDFENTLYAEMRFTSRDIEEGMTIEEAMHSFAERCGIKEMRKFASIYVQAVNRGPREAVNSMKIMSEEAWEQKKQISKQKGEIASQKLLMPNMIMFCGILVVVVAPILLNMFGSL